MPIPRPLIAVAGAVLLGVGLLPAALAGAAAAASPATVTVAPSTGLDRAGQTVSVSVSGVPEGAGVYLQWCPDNPAGTRWPSGTCASAPQVWLSSNPAALAQGAAALTSDPVDLAVTPTITTASGTTDCRTAACAVFLRLDHFSTGDTSLDTFVPVTFAAEATASPSPSPTTPTPEVPAYAVTAAPTTGLAAVGDTVAVTITGLAADAGVYVRLCALGTGGRPAADACDGQGRWVRETYPYGPYPTDGSVVKPSAGPVTLDVRARFGTVDCTLVTCGVHVRRDHLAPSDTTLDRAIPVTFAGATSSPDPTTSGSPSPSGSPDPSPSSSTSAPAPDAQVELGSVTTAPGGSVSLTASGFAAGERVLVELHSDPIELGTATASATGAVSMSVTVPTSTPAGEHTVVLTGQSSGRVAEASLVVAAATSPSPTGTPTTGAGSGSDADSGGTLATTGGSPLGAATVAGLLLAAGAALLVVARRRRPRH